MAFRVARPTGVVAGGRIVRAPCYTVAAARLGTEHA